MSSATLSTLSTILISVNRAEIESRIKAALTRLVPHCKTEQRINLLVVPDKPTLLIPKQTVRCAQCERSFYLQNEAKIIDGPFVA